MGQKLALRLLAAGHALSVFDRDTSRHAAAVERGGRALASAAELAGAADIVFLSLPSGEAVEEVVFAVDGIAAAGRRGTVVVDTSSIHPELTRSLARRLDAAVGGAWVDAPVSGGPGSAGIGTLACFVGGDAAVVERITPLLRCFAANITHLGPVGAGQIAKTCNQAVVCATIAAWVETLDYATRAGLDRGAIVAALAGGGADSAIRRAFAPVLAAGQVPGSAMILKDLDIIREMAAATRSAMPINERVAAVFAQRHTRTP